MRPKTLALMPSIVSGVLPLLLLSALAIAKDNDIECPGLRPPVHRGLTVRATFGGALWVGKIGENSRPGPAFSFGLGYEIFSFLAAEVAWTSGIFRTHQPSPPRPGDFASNALHAGLRFTLPLNRFDLFVRGGIGFLIVAPDILVRIPEVDGKLRLSWDGGAGFVWHTPRKHFWVGFEGGVVGASNFPGIQILAFGILGTTL
jgi:hypothetical protein